MTGHAVVIAGGGPTGMMLAAELTGFSMIRLDISDFPTRHPYGLALWQNHFERILAGWVGELGVPVYRGQEVTGFRQDDAGISVELTDAQPLRAQYLVGCDGGRRLIRKIAGGCCWPATRRTSISRWAGRASTPACRMR